MACLYAMHVPFNLNTSSCNSIKRDLLHVQQRDFVLNVYPFSNIPVTRMSYQPRDTTLTGCHYLWYSNYIVTRCKHHPDIEHKNASKHILVHIFPNLWKCRLNCVDCRHKLHLVNISYSEYHLKPKDASERSCIKYHCNLTSDCVMMNFELTWQ